jgi:peroxiredoxin
MESGAKRIWINIIGLILITFLSVDVIVLTIQNRELKSRFNATSAQPDPLKPGEQVEPFSFTTLDGGIANLDYSDSNTKYLLFVLSTTCPHCEKNLVAWKEIVDRNQNDQCNIMGLSLDNIENTKSYVASKNVSFVLSAVTDTSFSRKYKIAGVPETILIQNGTVEKAWLGELSKEQTSEIINLMSVQNALTNKQIN